MDGINASESSLIANVVFTACDIETTGLNPQKDAIIEIGAVKFKNRKTIERFSQLINPNRHIQNLGEDINKISPEMLAEQPPIDTVLPRFIDFINDTVLVGHNIQNFDLPFIHTNLIKLRLQPISNRIVDTYVLSRKTFLNQSRYSLEELSHALSIKTERTHRALDDAQACSQLLFRIIDEMSFLGETPPLQEILT